MCSVNIRLWVESVARSIIREWNDGWHGQAGLLFNSLVYPTDRSLAEERGQHRASAAHRTAPVFGLEAIGVFLSEFNEPRLKLLDDAYGWLKGHRIGQDTDNEVSAAALVAFRNVVQLTDEYTWGAE